MSLINQTYSLGLREMYLIRVTYEVDSVIVANWYRYLLTRMDLINN